MKRYLALCLSILMASLFWGCSDEEIINGSLTGTGEVDLRVFTTTPGLVDDALNTKGSFDEAHSDEGKVKQLAVLVFDKAADDGVLLQLETVTMTSGTNNGKVKLAERNNVHLRLVANYDLGTDLVGKTWSEIRTSCEFEVSNENTQRFPMTGEVSGFSVAAGNTIGSSGDPVKLNRALAKIAINISKDNFNYLGNKVCNIANSGYVFGQVDGAGNPLIATPDSTGLYSETQFNKNSITYSAERKNTGTDEKDPLDNRSYLLIQGEFAGVMSYYRVDFGSVNAEGSMEYKDFERNTNYSISITIHSHGYATPEEAINSPINRNIVETIITEGSAYEFLIDNDGAYLGVSNSIVTIFGKSKFIPNGFSDEPVPYDYVLCTITNEKTSDWESTDIQIVDPGLIQDARIEVVDKYDIDGNPIPGMKEYLLIGNTHVLAENGQQDPETTIRIRSGRLIKDITVQVWGAPIDCHYGVLGPTEDQLLTSCFIRKHRMANGGFFEGDIDWILGEELAFNSDLTGENCRTDQYGNANNQTHVAKNGKPLENLYIKYKEHVDVNTMGIFSDNAVNEGYRFADVYQTYYPNNERLIYTWKIILPQPNADLVGYFAGTPNTNSDYVSGTGGQYDGYLVVERISEYKTNTNDGYDWAKTLTSYCGKNSPIDDESLWRMPLQRQLMGVWLSNNSDSRKTSSLTEFDGLHYAKANYSKNMDAYLLTTRNWADTERKNDYPVTTSATYHFYSDHDLLPAIDFRTGDTFRGGLKNEENNLKVKGTIRCVRELRNDELPAALRNKTAVIAENKTVTMDPLGFLSDDYFRQDVPNPIARKIEVKEPHGNKDATAYFTYKGTGQNWTKHDVEIDAEYTLQEAYDASTQSGGYRLPTQRELQMLYIYYPLLSAAGIDDFYMEEGDGYNENDVVPKDKPNRMLWSMWLYSSYHRSEYYTPYLHWYWTSSTWNGDFNGNDNGTVIPQRINFHFGDVNARAAAQTGQKDHYRLVKTVN